MLGYLGRRRGLEFTRLSLRCRLQSACPKDGQFSPQGGDFTCPNRFTYSLCHALRFSSDGRFSPRLAKCSVLSGFRRYTARRSRRHHVQPCTHVRALQSYGTDSPMAVSNQRSRSAPSSRIRGLTGVCCAGHNLLWVGGARGCRFHNGPAPRPRHRIHHIQPRRLNHTIGIRVLTTISTTAMG